MHVRFKKKQKCKKGQKCKKKTKNAFSASKFIQKKQKWKDESTLIWIFEILFQNIMQKKVGRGFLGTLFRAFVVSNYF